MNNSVVKLVAGRILFFRILTKYDLKMGYLEIIKSDSTYQEALENFDEMKKKYKIVVAYNCLEQRLIAAAIMCLKTDKIDIHYVDDYEVFAYDIKKEMPDIVKNYSFDKNIFL